jgi:hypothetical protein
VYAPIYFPPPIPYPAARARRRARDLAAEGPYHVGGRYVADARLAADLRRTEAERIVATARRLVALYTPVPPCRRSAGDPRAVGR